MRRLEKITTDYWDVSNALRHPEPAIDMAVGDALRQIISSDRLRPDEWRLTDLVHVLRFDLIEGNTKWREQPQVANSTSTPPTKG